MSKKDLVNPFSKERQRFKEGSSLLTYGDDKYSVYSIVKKNNSRLYRSQVTYNDKALEDKILWKYEKQYYETDQSGRSMAEEVFDEKVEQAISEKQDFWSNLQPLRSSRHSNPYAPKKEFDIASNLTTSSFSKMTSSKTTFQTAKSDRKTHREEALKLKHRIQTKKQFQQKRPVEQVQFSLLNMYKKKPLQENHALPSAVTFGGLESRREKDQLKFQYPQSIYVGQEQYFFVPLG